MPLKNSEQTMLRVPPGTLDEVRKRLRDGESLAEFIRRAVLQAIARRAAK